MDIQASKDNYMSSGNSAYNYGTETTLYLYNLSTNKDRPILSFDASGWTRPVSEIKAAKLNLYYYGNSGFDPVGLAVNVYKIRRTDWVEAESSWDIYKTGSNWGTAGASNTTSDIDTSVAATFNMPADTGWVEIDITDIVKDAITNNSGIVNVRISFDVETDTSPNQNLALFYSKEYTDDTSLRPKLVIDMSVALAGETATWTGGTLVYNTASVISGVILSLVAGAISILKRSFWTNQDKNTEDFDNQTKNG